MKYLTPSAVAFFVLGLAAPAGAYPIPPSTLWELTEEADLVVLATVVRTEPGQESEKDPFTRDVAVLQVKEVWKGKVGAEVRVSYSSGMICPAPPRFEPLLDVVAFLERTRDGKSYHVGSLSYGTLYPEFRDLPAFRSLVKEAMALQASADKSAAARNRTEWLVKAVEEPATRWHGLYELDSSSDGMHAFYDNRQRTGRADLTPEQRQRILKAFAERPRLDGNLVTMLSLIGSRPSAEVYQTAVAAIDTLLEEKAPPYWTFQLVALTRARLGMSPPPAPAKPAKKKQVSFEDDPIFATRAPDFTALRKEWQQVRKTLAFPPRRLALPAQTTVRGVGAETPP